MSLEYSVFRFSDDYPTAEGLSEMIMEVCMDDRRRGAPTVKTTGNLDSIFLFKHE